MVNNARSTKADIEDSKARQTEHSAEIIIRNYFTQNSVDKLLLILFSIKKATFNPLSTGDAFD